MFVQYITLDNKRAVVYDKSSQSYAIYRIVFGASAARWEPLEGNIRFYREARLRAEAM